MNIQELKAIVRKSITPGAFNLDTSLLHSTPVFRLAGAYFKGNRLKLALDSSSESTREDGSSMTVMGKGIDPPFKDLAVDLVFGLDSSGNAGVSLTAKAGRKMVLSDVIPDLKGTLGDRIALSQEPPLTLTLASDQTNPNPPAMTFSAEMDLESTHKGLAELLGNPSLALKGTLEYAKNGAQLKAVLLNGPQVAPVDLLIAKACTVGCAVGIHQYENGFDNTTVSVPFIRLTTTIPFTAQGTKHTLPLSVDISNFDTPIRFSADINDGIDAAFDELEALANHAGLSGLVPKHGFAVGNVIKVSQFSFDYDLRQKKMVLISIKVNSTNPWTVLTLPETKQKIEAVNVALDFAIREPFGKKSSYVMVLGDFVLGEEGIVCVHAHYPGWEAQAYLKGGTVLKLTELIDLFIGTQKEIPEIDIYGLGMDIASDHYAVNCTAAGDWTLVESVFPVALTGIAFSIDHDGAKSKAWFDGRLTLAGIDFELEATHDSQGKGWLFSGRAAQQSQINLSTFASGILKTFGLPALPASVPEVDLKDLDLTFNTASKAFCFSGESLTKASVPLCNVNLDLDARVTCSSDVDPQTGKRRFGGSFTADLNIGHAVFELSYVFGKAVHVIEGHWAQGTGKPVSIDDLLATLGVPNSLQLPHDIDFLLKEISFAYNVTKEVLTATVDSVSLGEGFIQIGKIFDNTAKEENQTVSESWEVIFGLMLPETWRFSDIPGRVGHVLSPFDFLAFEHGCLIISTLALGSFTIPSLPAGKGLTLSLANVDKSGMKLVEGVNLGCTIDFNQHTSDPRMGHLGAILPEPKLLLACQIDGKHDAVDLEAKLQGEVVISGKGSDSLAFGDAALKLTSSPLSFSVSGDMQIPFSVSSGKETIYAIGRIGITDAEIEAMLEVSASLPGPDGTLVPASLDAPMGLPGIKLDELAVEFGAMWEPPGIDLGIEGQFHIGGEPVGDDKFAVVFDLEGEVPNPTLLYCHIAELSMEELVIACLDTSVNLPPFIRDINMSDLTVYWAESDQYLPDGTPASQGFGFNGFIDIYGFAAHAGLMVKASQGISGDAEMPPITLPGIAITGRGTGVTVNQMYVNDQWETVDRFPPTTDQTPRKTRTVQLIPPGGPFLQFNTLSSPYFAASIRVNLLHLYSEEIDVEISEKGIAFELEYKIGVLADFKLACILKDISSFSASAGFDLGLKADIGPIVIFGVNFGTIHLDVGFFTDFSLAIDSHGFDLKVGGSFEFEGASLTMPTLTLDASFTDMAKLPEEIVKQLDKEAAHIFKALFDDIGAILKEGLKEIEKIGKEAAKEAEEIGKAAAEQAEKVLDDAKKTAEIAAHEAEKEAKKIAAEAEDIAKAGEEAVAHIATAAAAEVEKIGKEAEAVFNDAAKEVSKIEKAVAAEVDAVAQEIAGIGQAAAAEVEKIGEEAAQEAEKVIHEAEEEVKRIAQEAERIAADIEEEADKIFDDVKEFAKKAEEEARKAAEAVSHAIKHAAKKVWHTISKY